jgi:zinc protease
MIGLWIARRLLLGTLAVLFVCTAVRSQTLHLPPHEKFVLKNGLTVLLLEKHGVPLINITAIVKTGAAGDPEGKAGLASATAGLLRKGTKTRTAQQFAAELDYIGAAFETEAQPDFTSLRAEFLSKDLVRGLDLLVDALAHPIFPQYEVDKLLSQALDAVRTEKDDPRSVMVAYFDGYLYGAHPYGHPPRGDELSLRQIGRDAITKFYETNYVPGNTILAVAGDFKSAEMHAKLEEVMGSWPPRTVKSTTIPAATPTKGKRLLLVDKPDSTQTYFAIGNTGISVTDPDRVAIRVVNTIFGGKFTSELNEALRVESGYTYGAESLFEEAKVAGPFVISSFTKNETTTQAIDLALQVLAKLHKDGVTQDQLNSAKTYLKGQFPPEIETSKQLAQLIALHDLYGLGDDEINQFEARVDGVSVETARQVIQKHFPAENLIFVLIGNASAIAPSVKKYATSEDVRPIGDPGFWPPLASAKK